VALGDASPHRAGPPADAYHNLTQQFYDGNLTGTQAPNRLPAQEFYDADGNVAETISAAGDTSYTYYDLDGRVSGTADAYHNLSEQFYDSDGNLSGTEDPNRARGARVLRHRRQPHGRPRPQ